MPSNNPWPSYLDQVKGEYRPTSSGMSIAILRKVLLILSGYDCLVPLSAIELRPRGEESGPICRPPHADETVGEGGATDVANEYNVLPVGIGHDIIGFAVGGSSSGRTADSGSARWGSNPCPPANTNWAELHVSPAQFVFQPIDLPR